MTDLLDAARALEALAGSAREATRLLRLSFPHRDGPAGTLMLAHRLDADEGLSRDFAFEVEVLCDRPDLDPEELLGRMVTVELARADGSVRHFNGYVFAFRFLRNDAGHCFYSMVLRPWLAFLRYRRNQRLFHGKTLEEQRELICADYEVHDCRVLRLGADEPMTEACQWAETDYNYLHRRWEAKGWLYWYEHRADGHTLVLCGDSASCPPLDGGPRVRWQGTSGVRGAGISRLSRARSLASTLYTAASFDFKRPRPAGAASPALRVPPHLPPLEVYEYAGAYGFSGRAAGDAFARLRMEELEAQAERFEAGGDEDRAEAGRRMHLGCFPDVAVPAPDGAADGFLIVEARHVASNNHLAGDGGTAGYRNSLVCVRSTAPWRPGRGYNSREPRVDGLQTALVVGPAGEEVHADEHGRVRVQFHWDRQGGYDERSSAWVRVASPWAGSDLGQTMLPRAGQEVLVQWLDGNPDRPLITGSVHNVDNRPPRFSHADGLPDGRFVSGIKSREVAGQRYNQLRLDDTPGQISAQIESEHGRSQLNLGYLTQPRRAGGGEPRGEGAELRSDAAVAVRGGEGVLISSAASPAAGGDQLDRDELLGLARTLQALVEQLGEQAGARHAGGSDAARFGQLVRHLQEWERGSNTTTAAARGASGAPVVAVSAAAGCAVVSQDNLVLGAQTHIDAASGGHVQTTAGGQIRQRAGAGISSFAHAGGIRTIAGQGPVELQAQQGDIHLTASDTLVLTAGSRIVIQAPEVQIVGQGAHTQWGAGSIVEQTSGAFVVKAAKFAQVGPGAGAPAGVELPSGTLRTDEKYVLRLRGAGTPVTGRRYCIELSDGRRMEGRSDAQGGTLLAESEAMHIATITLFDD